VDSTGYCCRNYHIKSRALIPSDRADVRSSLLLQGKGKHSYKLHHTRPDYTVSRQHDRQTNIYGGTLHPQLHIFTLSHIVTHTSPHNMAAAFPITNIHGQTSHKTTWPPSETPHSQLPIYTDIRHDTTWPSRDMPHPLLPVRHNTTWPTHKKHGRRASSYIPYYQYTRRHTRRNPLTHTSP
jgi:hypothetical protein